MKKHPPIQLSEAVTRELAELMAEEHVFIRSNVLYYKHESGTVFSAPRAQLTEDWAAQLQDPAPATPFRFAIVSGVPSGAKPYHPREGKPGAERVDDWTDFCDSQAA